MTFQCNATAAAAPDLTVTVWGAAPLRWTWVPTHVQRSGATPHTVTVKSGAAAAVALHWNVIPSGSTPCHLARWLRVTPPGGTSTLRVYFHDTACRGELGVGPVTDPRTV